MVYHQQFLPLFAMACSDNSLPLPSGHLTAQTFKPLRKDFFETLGKSGATGLIELFACNDEPAQAITRMERNIIVNSLPWVGI